MRLYRVVKTVMNTNKLTEDSALPAAASLTMARTRKSSSVQQDASTRIWRKSDCLSAPGSRHRGSSSECNGAMLRASVNADKLMIYNSHQWRVIGWWVGVTGYSSGWLVSTWKAALYALFSRPLATLVFGYERADIFFSSLKSFGNMHIQYCEMEKWKKNNNRVVHKMKEKNENFGRSFFLWQESRKH